MPTYEYECSKGHTFEVVQRITENPLERCTVCNAKARRLISAANFILKGSGWYADGYSSGKGSSNGATSDSSDTGGSASKSSSEKGSDSGKGSASSAD